MSSEEGPARRVTASTEDPDSFIEPLLVLHGNRVEMEQEQIPEYFSPITGKWKIKGMCKRNQLLAVWILCGLFQITDLLKTLIDDKAYDLSYGDSYKTYGIDVNEGAVVIVRPDQCKLHLPSPRHGKLLCILTGSDVALVTSLDDHKTIAEFFAGFALPQ